MNGSDNAQVTCAYITCLIFIKVDPSPYHCGSSHIVGGAFQYDARDMQLVESVQYESIR